MNQHGLVTTNFAVEQYYPVKDKLAYMETWFVPKQNDNKENNNGVES